MGLNDNSFDDLPTAVETVKENPGLTNETYGTLNRQMVSQSNSDHLLQELSQKN